LNPCDTGTCFDGEFAMIAIDCEEQMGIPCDGGEWQEQEGECCSLCVVDDTPTDSEDTAVCPDGCTTWFDGCNTCECSSQGPACTRMYCFQQETPRCLDPPEDNTAPGFNYNLMGQGECQDLEVFYEQCGVNSLQDCESLCNTNEQCRGIFFDLHTGNGCCGLYDEVPTEADEHACCECYARSSADGSCEVPSSFQSSSTAERVENGESYTDPLNPCDTGTCFDGYFAMIAIDCEEQMGIPCDGGEWQEQEGECCSSCVVDDTPTDSEATPDGSCEVPPGFPSSLTATRVANGEDYTDPLDPCDTGTCFDGDFTIIAFYCPERMGMPCDGGEWQQQEGECCSSCVITGKSAKRSKYVLRFPMAVLAGCAGVAVVVAVGMVRRSPRPFIVRRANPQMSTLDGVPVPVSTVKCQQVVISEDMKRGGGFS